MISANEGGCGHLTNDDSLCDQRSVQERAPGRHPEAIAKGGIEEFYTASWLRRWWTVSRPMAA